MVHAARITLTALLASSMAPTVSAASLDLITADIRPAAFIGQARDADRVQRGRAIAERGVAVQGGRAAWESKQSLHLEVTDDWDLTPFRMYMPLADDHVTFEGDITLHTNLSESTWTVTSGKGEDDRFGVHEGRAWEGTPDQDGGAGARFFAPTMEYLPTLAFHIPSAEVVSWVDTVQRDGVAFDRVFVTWGDPEAPSASMDQYLVYYAQDTGLLTYVECTVRDFGPFITGSVRYGDWTGGDVSLPSTYAMHLVDLDGPRVHRVSLDALSWR